MVKGLRHIRTHGSLAREGRFFGVAKNLRQEVKRGEFSGEGSWDGNVKSFVSKSIRKRLLLVLFLDANLKRKVYLNQIQQLQDLVAEMEQFLNEGIKGAATELQSLKRRLGRWEEGV